MNNTTMAQGWTALPFQLASDAFFDLAQNSPSHFGATYSCSDHYHDWFFSLGTIEHEEVILAITVQGACAMEDEASRDYFEGTIRLLGRPAGMGDDGEFSSVIGFDSVGLFTQSTGGLRRSARMHHCNQALVTEHFSHLASAFNTDNACEVIRKIIHHEQVRLLNMARLAGAPLLWKHS